MRLDFFDAEMEPAGVPALLAYQGGDKFAGLVPLLQEMEDEDELSASSLEVVLRKYEVAPFFEDHCKAIANTFVQTPNLTMKKHATTLQVVLYGAHLNLASDLEITIVYAYEHGNPALTDPLDQQQANLPSLSERILAH